MKIGEITELIFFADTSAFAKRYVQEAGSGWVRSWINPNSGNVTIISEIGTVEMISVLARKQRELAISTNDLQSLQNDFLWHVDNEYLVMNLNDEVYYSARSLLLRHTLRTLDALQLACGIVARQIINEPITYVVGDGPLGIAATAEGFSTENPNLH